MNTETKTSKLCTDEGVNDSYSLAYKVLENIVEDTLFKEVDAQECNSISFPTKDYEWDVQ